MGRTLYPSVSSPFQIGGQGIVEHKMLPCPFVKLSCHGQTVQGLEGGEGIRCHFVQNT